MYIANLTIETSEGTFNAGEEVKGLSSSEATRMKEAGYITVKADKAEKAEEVAEEKADEKKKSKR